MYDLKTSYLPTNKASRSIEIVLLLLVCSLFSKAQQPALTLGTVGICSNTSVLVPLKGNNLSNIGAITLFINYDDQKLSFSSIENLDPQLEGLLVNTLSNPSRIGIVWSKTSGASFINAALLDLKFEVLNQTADLSFIKSDCEIANISLPPQVVEVIYNNGGVFPAKPIITSEPENKTVVSQSNAVFQVVTPNTSAFTWQESRNDGVTWSDLHETNLYSGTQTNILNVRHIPVSYNQFMYRCILNSNNCLTVSANAILSVDSLSGTAEQLSKENLHLANSPNPFSGKTILEYTVPENGYVTIRIFSMTGQIMGMPVESPHSAGSYRVEDNFVYLPVGIYFCQYVFKGSTGVYETYRKLIKINR